MVPAWAGAGDGPPLGSTLLTSCMRHIVNNLDLCLFKNMGIHPILEGSYYMLENTTRGSNLHIVFQGTQPLSPQPRGKYSGSSRRQEPKGGVIQDFCPVKVLLALLVRVATAFQRLQRTTNYLAIMPRIDQLARSFLCIQNSQMILIPPTCQSIKSLYKMQLHQVFSKGLDSALQTFLKSSWKTDYNQETSK